MCVECVFLRQSHQIKKSIRHLKILQKKFASSIKYINCNQAKFTHFDKLCTPGCGCYIHLRYSCIKNHLFSTYGEDTQSRRRRQHKKTPPLHISANLCAFYLCAWRCLVVRFILHFSVTKIYCNLCSSYINRVLCIVIISNYN